MFFKLVTAAAFSLAASIASASDDVTARLTQLAENTLSVWTSDPMVIAAVKAQNAETAGYSNEQILALDKTWRAETVTGGDLISSVLSKPLSAHLKKLKEAGHGQFTEIFVTDGRGLNVAQSDVTSDYWQGDEDKWQVPVATRAPHMGSIEFDESTQGYQSQISLPIISEGAVIGVITVGVNVEQIASN